MAIFSRRTPPEQYRGFAIEDLGDSIDRRYPAEHSSSAPRSVNYEDARLLFVHMANSIEHLDEGSGAILKPIVDAFHAILKAQSIEFSNRQREHVLLLLAASGRREVHAGMSLLPVRERVERLRRISDEVDKGLAENLVDFTERPDPAELPAPIIKKRRREAI